LNLTDPTELTIAAGTVTLTQGAHTIDTEADAASDDLVTITAAKGIGDFVLLIPENDARSIVLKHGTGNIFTFDGTDVTLDTDDHWAILFRIGSRWLVMSNSAGGGVSSDMRLWERAYFTGASLDTVSGLLHMKVATESLTIKEWEAEVGTAGTVPVQLALYINGAPAAGSPTITLSNSAAGGGMRRYARATLADLGLSAGDLLAVVVVVDGTTTDSAGPTGTAAVGPLMVGVSFIPTPA
jgi:hypothetical protein